MKLRPVVMMQMSMDSAEYSMAATVIRIQSECLPCGGECAFKLLRKLVRGPTLPDRQSQIGVAGRVLGIELDGLLEQAVRIWAFSIRS